MTQVDSRYSDPSSKVSPTQGPSSESQAPTTAVEAFKTKCDGLMDQISTVQTKKAEARDKAALFTFGLVTVPLALFKLCAYFWQSHKEDALVHSLAKQIAYIDKALDAHNKIVDKAFTKQFPKEAVAQLSQDEIRVLGKLKKTLEDSLKKMLTGRFSAKYEDVVTTAQSQVQYSLDWAAVQTPAGEQHQSKKITDPFEASLFRTVVRMTRVGVIASPDVTAFLNRVTGGLM